MNNQLVRPTAQLASRAWKNLNGLFAVYKPSGMPVKYVKETIQTSLIEGKYQNHTYCYFLMIY